MQKKDEILFVLGYNVVTNDFEINHMHWIPITKAIKN